MHDFAKQKSCTCQICFGPTLLVRLKPSKMSPPPVRFSLARGVFLVSWLSGCKSHMTKPAPPPWERFFLRWADFLSPILIFHLNSPTFHGMKYIFPLVLLLFSFLSFGQVVSTSSTSDSNLSQSLRIESSYCTEAELAERKSPFSLIETPSDWYFQYPSGSEKGGMISQKIPSSFKSKYLSACKVSDSKNYLRFSLDASD